MIRIIPLFVMAGTLGACHDPGPAAAPEAALTIDVPTHMTSVADALIEKAVANRYDLRRFRRELERELGRLYSERRIDSRSLPRSDLERGGWKGETIYHFGLDACVECMVYVNRDGIIVGPCRAGRDSRDKDSLTDARGLISSTISIQW
ncbi:MAG: hypothetical protein J0M04_01885 [Verrucomicrobia bacterium]|nr:hypothetical protein [Verrucomicrobiota bacterium]